MKKLLALLVFFALQLNAANNSISANPQLIHEAFVVPVRDIAPQEVLVRQAPALKAETPPAQPNAQTVWIPGYWSWKQDKQDFVWVCGVWRLPPPDHFWLPGDWKAVNGGWTWVRGAWLENKMKTTPIVYTQVAPPASQNEDTGNSPGAGYFWCAGYWDLSQATTTYEWLSGSWQKFEPKWIFIPSHWIWRPEGYLFVSAYWDWPLDTRGIAYDCNTQAVLSPQMIAQQLTSCYPDYVSECCYYQYTQPLFWAGCDCLPPWWSWDDWWALPWADSWWLWWWYLNDGYPFPPFIVDILDQIPPPTQTIIDTFANFPPPIFITPVGVPNIDIWIEVIGGNNGPLIPPGKITTIIDTFTNKITHTGKDRPKGSKGGGHVRKPVGKHLKPAKGKATIPHTPTNTASVNTHTAAVPTVPTVTAPPITVVQPQVPINQPTYIQQSYIPPTQYYPGEVPISYPPGYGGRNWGGGGGGWNGGHGGGGGWNGGHGGGGGWNGGGGHGEGHGEGHGGGHGEGHGEGHGHGGGGGGGHRH